MKVSSIIANIDYKTPEGIDKAHPDGMSKGDVSKFISKAIPKDSTWQPQPVEFKAEGTSEVDWKALKDELTRTGAKPTPLKGKVSLVG